MDILRTLLYVPADNPKKMAKARTVHPDGFIFDLEDAVVPSRKAEARTLLLRELDALHQTTAKIWVRINSLRSGLWKDDLAVAVHPNVSVISLPKSEDSAEIALIDRSIAEREAALSIPRGQIRLHLIIESALGVLRAQELARASERVSALSFGAQDYAAEMGISSYTNAPVEFVVPKSLVAMTAQAFRLQAIGGVFTNLDDVDGLMEDTKRGIREGFTGKTLIHPAQIEPVHRAFCPSEQEAVWAREIVDAFEAAKAEGTGVVAVRGRMVDEPVLLQALRILRRFEAGSH
jgi:citrate lyase subunit beta/citryl-CoA lyase